MQARKKNIKKGAYSKPNERSKQGTKQENTVTEGQKRSRRNRQDCER